MKDQNYCSDSYFISRRFVHNVTHSQNHNNHKKSKPTAKISCVIMVLEDVELLGGRGNEQVGAVPVAVFPGRVPVPRGCGPVEATQVLQHRDGGEGGAAGWRRQKPVEEDRPFSQPHLQGSSFE